MEEQGHRCPQCAKSFATLKRRNEHEKRKHSPASSRTCGYCSCVLADTCSLARHVAGCVKNPSNALECAIEPRIIPACENTPHHKVMSRSFYFSASHLTLIVDRFGLLIPDTPHTYIFIYLKKCTPKANIKIVEEYLLPLWSYLEGRAFFNTFKTTQDQLRPAIIASYISFICKDLEVIVSSLRKRKSGNRNLNPFVEFIYNNHR